MPLKNQQEGARLQLSYYLVEVHFDLGPSVGVGVEVVDNILSTNVRVYRLDICHF